MPATSAPGNSQIFGVGGHITRPAQPQPRPNLDNRSSLAYRFLIILTLVSFVNGDSKLIAEKQSVRQDILAMSSARFGLSKICFFRLNLFI